MVSQHYLIGGNNTLKTFSHTSNQTNQERLHRLNAINDYLKKPNQEVSLARFVSTPPLIFTSGTMRVHDADTEVTLPKITLCNPPGSKNFISG